MCVIKFLSASIARRLPYFLFSSKRRPLERKKKNERNVSTCTVLYFNFKVNGEPLRQHRVIPQTSKHEREYKETVIQTIFADPSTLILKASPAYIIQNNLFKATFEFPPSLFN